MKKHILPVVCLLLLLVSQAWGGQFGPITSRIDSGQLSLAGGYTWLTEKYDNGSYQGDLDVKQNSVYLQAGVGLPAGWQVSLRGGGADYQVDDPYQYLDSDESSDDLRPFVGLAVGGPVFSGSTLTGGPFLQVSYYSEYDTTQKGFFTYLDNSNNKVTGTGKERVYFDNALVAELGFTFQLSIEGALLYFGPTYSYYNSDIYSVVTSDDGLLRNTSDKDDLKLDAPFGGFVGISWTLTNRLHLDLEASYRSGAVLGTQLLYTF